MEALTRLEQVMRAGPRLAMGRTLVRVGLTSEDFGLMAAGWDLINCANAALNARPAALFRK